MKNFIDTSKIVDRNELLDALKKNVQTAYKLKQEISKIEKAKEIEESDIQLIETAVKEVTEEPIEIEESDVDYEYYYQYIKNVSLDIDEHELETIIRNSLPKKSNTNYFRIFNRIKAEIYMEIISYKQMTYEIDDKEFLEEINANILFEQLKLKLIDKIDKELVSEDTIEDKNKIFFLKTSSGNIYALEDLKDIDIEYYPSFLELFLSIQNGTFKNVKLLNSSNNKTNAIAEVRAFKTRIMFDRIGVDSYAILEVTTKKCDYDNGYKKTLENRVATYKDKKEQIISMKDDEEFIKENDEILKVILEKLSNNKKKVLQNDEKFSGNNKKNR